MSHNHITEIINIAKTSNTAKIRTFSRIGNIVRLSLKPQQPARWTHSEIKVKSGAALLKIQPNRGHCLRTDDLTSAGSETFAT